MRRVGWEPSVEAKKIAGETDPENTSYIADIGGGHGREALWLAEQGYRSILIEPNKYSLEFAKKRARKKRLDVDLISAVLPYLPMRSEVIDVVDFYWTLHQIPDEYKLESLREICRIMKHDGTLYSTSFGCWEDHIMPSSIYPIVKKQAFLDLHISVGFKLYGKIENRYDSNRPFEKFWFGIFRKSNPQCA